MDEFLKRHALDNIWCSPFQDRQAILRLSRQTPDGGVLNYVPIQYVRHNLPTRGERYNVYLIGQNSAQRLNLPSTTGKWFNVAELMNERGLTVDLYTTDGRMFSRGGTYIKRTKNKNYILAIKQQRNIATLSDRELFARFYSNAFFNTTRAQGLDHEILTDSVLVTYENEQLPLQQRFLDLKAMDVGHAYAFVSGYYVENFKPSQVSVGDWVEIVHDSSIRDVHEWRLSDLDTFTSSLDARQKYLVHPPKNLDTIDYNDDVDFFIGRRGPDGTLKALYLHQNRRTTVRMVTHQDWALDAGVVIQYLTDNEWQLEDVVIIAHVKNSGYDRPLVNTHNRIKELYRLDDAEIYGAMMGINATLPEWRAAELEVSAYTRIMRSYIEDVTGQEALRAYGYNAAAKLIADTPQRLTDGKAKLPVGLQSKSTVYEYNEFGRLLGFYQHSNSEFYYARNESATLIEAISGYGDFEGNFIYGHEPVQLDKRVEYRFYVSTLKDGLPTNRWEDVTDRENEYYEIVDGTLNWLIDPDGQIGCVKGDDKFVSYEIQLENNELAVEFSINRERQGNVNYIPPGHLEVWLNGRNLVRDIDYKVIYPKVVVTNQKYLSPKVNDIVVRETGFCSSDMKLIPNAETGFVLYERLSLNKVYNVRDEKIIRCNVAGALLHRDDIGFAENSNEAGVRRGYNGLPYAISEPQAPIRGMVDYDTHPRIRYSKEVDQRVSDYLSNRLEQNVPDTPPYIPEYYPLYSPTMAKIIDDLVKGYKEPLSPYVQQELYTQWMEDYDYLMAFEPLRNPAVDPTFATVRPHPLNEGVEVTKEMYVFLGKINELYLDNKLDLSSWLYIKDTQE